LTYLPLVFGLLSLTAPTPIQSQPMKLPAGPEDLKPEPLAEPPAEVVPEKLPQPKSPDELLATLKLNITNIPELTGVKLTAISAVEKTPTGELLKLAGSIPTEDVRPKLKDRCDSVLKIFTENKVLTGGPYTVDVTAMEVISLPKPPMPMPMPPIDTTTTVEQRIADVLHRKLFGPDRAIQGRLTGVTAMKDGTVYLYGWVHEPLMRIVAEKEAPTILNNAVRTDNLPGPYLKVDASSLRVYPSPIYALVESSLPTGPEAAGFKVFSAELTPSGVLELVGVAASEEQKNAMKSRISRAVAMAIDGGAFPKAKFERADLNRVFVGSSAVEELLAIESLCPSKSGHCVRGQLYVPESGELILTGIVESQPSLDLVVARLQNIPGLNRVDATNVLIRQGGGFRPGQPMGTLTDAHDALGRSDWQGVLANATSVIRNAVPNSQATVRAWYLRAAANIAMGRRQEAAGDLRMGQAQAEHVVGGDPYSLTLERFQGPVRIALSNLLRDGPLTVASGRR